MREKGKAMLGGGEASGEKRVLTAAVAAISNPLIEDARPGRNLLRCMSPEVTQVRGRDGCYQPPSA